MTVLTSDQATEIGRRLFKREPVACRVCGEPTLSAFRLCIACCADLKAAVPSSWTKEVSS